MNHLKGTGVALITPFTSNGEVDTMGIKKLMNHVVARLDYVVALGTTGEAVTLNQREKQLVLDSVLENANSTPVVVGHGGNDTAELIRGFNTFNLGSACAILSASPAYNKPSQRGIIAHYTALADASPLPIILYNVPGRTASNMVAETTLKLAEHENIVGIKEASGNLDQFAEIAAHRPPNFLLISGDDNLVVPHMAYGADGIISVLANVFPSRVSAIVGAAGGPFDAVAARNSYFEVAPLIPLLFAEGNPVGVKSAASALGICHAHVRLPLVPASDQLASRIAENCVLLNA